MEQVHIPVFATFYIRDGKAARDAGNTAEMMRQIQKATIDHRLTQEQKDVILDKIRNAPYHPNPTKPVSGCVVKGYSRVYTASKVADPLAMAQARIEEMHKAGLITDEEADERLSKIQAKTQEREKALLAERKAKALAEVDALLA